jgi:hypothetical protein
MTLARILPKVETYQDDSSELSWLVDELKILVDTKDKVIVLKKCMQKSKKTYQKRVVI